jgi:predicted hotdog family 3-hydroxylacyl-ACP dehydratase
MIITKENIQDFIPQRPPFIMIDNLIEAADDLFKTDFRILPDNIFIENGMLREFAMIENVAQSCAAGLAVTKKYADKGKPEGYLGAVSKLKLYELPGTNDRIFTVVKVMAQLKNMFLLKGENYLNDKKLMECELKLVSI